MLSIYKAPRNPFVFVRLLPAIIFLCLPFCSRSQLAFGTPMDNIRLLQSDRFYMLNGKPLLFNSAVEIMEGTPFFKDEWMPGLAQLNDSSLRRGAGLKLNLLENRVHILSGGRELVVNDTLLRLTLTDTVSGKEYHFCTAKLWKVRPQPMQGGTSY
jgi:hypothetical protein